MKKQILFVLSAITCLLAACSTANFAYYDDIYSTTGENDAQSVNASASQKATGKPAVEADSIIYETDENGNLLRTLTYYPGSTEPVVTTYMEVVDDSTAATGASSSYAYDPDDYYDYAYSSRLRRFHTNVYAGWGYYDPFFTNLYWYDYSPASFGISIYLGYNWWWPNYYYRPYYYAPCWYDYGWRYGWGWHGPHYVYYDPCHHHHYHHGCAPVDYYHNHRDPNHSYYYGHRNNLGPSVGNPGNGRDRGERPDGGNNLAGGMGGGTNNHYSVTSTPVSFNQRYDQLAGTTGAGSSSNGTATPSSARTDLNGKTASSARTEPSSNVKPTTAQPINNGNTTRPASVAADRTEGTATNIRPSAATTNTNARPSAATTNTNARPSATTSATAPRTVTRTVVTPSSANARPTNNGTARPTTSRPSSGTTTITRTVPSNNNARPASTTRPSATSTPSRSYNRPSNSSTNSRPSYSAPANGSRSNYSTPERNNSRSNYSSPSHSSRSSYSSPSSSSRSSYGGGSTHSGSFSRGGGGSYSSGSHASGRR